MNKKNNLRIIDLIEIWGAEILVFFPIVLWIAFPLGLGAGLLISLIYYFSLYFGGRFFMSFKKKK